jgi:DNA polymerase (family 10)
MDNTALAAVLDQVGDLLEIQEANPFRVRAYRNAARTVAEQTTPMATLVDQGTDLTTLPGIGKEMASHLVELLDSGRLALLDELAAKVPLGLVELLRVPGLGPKKARRLWQELGITSVGELEALAKAGKVAGLAGFGQKSEEKILAGIADLAQHRNRMLLADAERVVEALAAWLGEVDALARLEVAGSFRRRRETVGDLDLLAVAAAGEAVMARLCAFPGVASVLARGETKTSVVLSSGLQVDLRVIPEQSWGAALVYFTGSKEHNIELRKRGVERGLRISEYGVFREEDRTDEAAPAPGTDQPPAAAAPRPDPWAGVFVAGATEEAVYATVGLPWIAPELRENRGEIRAAARGELPRLLELADLRGDLQMHSTWSDGKNTAEEMLVACKARGYSYMALTDHSQALAMVRGLDPVRLRQQWAELAKVQDRHPEIRLLRAMEVDILADGSLDLPDEDLARLDLVLVSIHSRFDLPQAEQTKRVLRALAHPCVDVFAHPTARIINRRRGVDLDMEAVLQLCAERGVAVELDSAPDRLDLRDTHLIRARELGCRVVISTDAHKTSELAWIRHGVEQARRAWLEPRHVLNTLPLEGLLGAIGREGENRRGR